jgi:DNA-binding CsgD family transcriptional regulator
MNAIEILEKIHIEFLRNIGLTKQEKNIIVQLCVGKSDKQIARMLGLSIRTVNTYINHVYQRLGLDNQAENARCSVLPLLLDQDIIKITRQAHDAINKGLMPTA